jgi:Nif-specific regulatory protein
MAFLLWIQSDERQLRFPIGETTVLGRSSDCDVQILAPSLSRRHAQIRRSDGGYLLEDVGSASGTYVNGLALEGETRLVAGDLIRLGSENLVFDPPIDVLPSRDGPQVYLLKGGDASPANRLDSEPSAEIRDLHRLSRRLLEALDTAALLEVLTSELRSAFSARSAVILARGPAGWRALSAASDSGRVAVSQSLLERVADEGKPLAIEDATGDVRFRGAESVVSNRLRSVMAVPIRDGDRVVAIAQVDHADRGVYGTADLERLAAVAEVAGLALSRAARLTVSEDRAPVRADDLVGKSKALGEAVELASRAAESEARILISGESGTGKELLARFIHEQSRRAQGPWVAINCGALAEGIVDSELFGHEDGAFTGAQGRRAGCFERADGGTLFLDEVAELPLETQAKLLRVLQEGRFYRVGGELAVDVDVRIVAASHRDLKKEVTSGCFREDLLYRLRVLEISMPSLRERPEDIPPLTRHFIAELSRGSDAPVLAPSALECFAEYRWPGNVRELRNAVERLVVLHAGSLVEAEHLPAEMRSTPHPGRSVGTLADAVGAVEREMILTAMERSGGNKSQAARALGISRPTLDKKLAKLEDEG